MRKALFAIGAAGALMAGWSSIGHADSVFTLTGSDLAGLTYVTNGTNTASYSSGLITLTTTGGGGFSDTGTVVIPNGYLGATLGATLSDL